MTSRGRPPAEAWRHHRRLVHIGQMLMGLGLLIVVVHVGAHLSGSPSGWTDLTFGYPTGVVLGIGGAVLAGRAQPRRRG